MPERSLETTCPECGDALSFHPWEERPTRCATCFESYLRRIDNDFLASYGELGVASRRTVAETCLRALVLESPPVRKILSMTIMEQFLLASADLIGLYHALKDRHREPIVRSFLSFRLDGDASRAFFSELQEAPDGELLGALGLPEPQSVSTHYPAREARDVADSLRALLRDLRTTGQRSSSALLLGQLTGQVRGGPALVDRPSWLGGSHPEPVERLRPDQVASLVLDERRRCLAVQAMPADEHRLAELVDAIDCMTRAASNMIYAYLIVQDEEERVRALAER